MTLGQKYAIWLGRLYSALNTSAGRKSVHIPWDQDDFRTQGPRYLHWETKKIFLHRSDPKPKRKRVMLRCGRCGWDVVRRWDTSLESWMEERIGEGSRARHQWRGDWWLQHVSAASQRRMFSIDGTAKWLLLQTSLLHLFHFQRGLIKSGTFYSTSVFVYMCSVRWKSHWMLFTGRDQYLPGPALENAAVHRY